jgi:hypothetical protein
VELGKITKHTSSEKMNEACIAIDVSTVEIYSIQSILVSDVTMIQFTFRATLSESLLAYDIAKDCRFNPEIRSSLMVED